eukprot:10316-Heterococcus_DN1.PRE.2
MNSAKSVGASHFAALYNADEVGNELFSIEHMMCYSADSLLTTAMRISGTSGSTTTSSSSSSGGSKRSSKAGSSSGISSSTAVIAEVRQDDITAMLSSAITCVAKSITATTAAAAEAAISSFNSTNYNYAVSSDQESVSFTDMMLQLLGVTGMLRREPLTRSSHSSNSASSSSIQGSSISRSNGSGSSRSKDVHKRSAVQISDSDSSSDKLSYTKKRFTKRCKSTASYKQRKQHQQLPYAYGSRRSHGCHQHRSVRDGSGSNSRGSGSSSSRPRHSQKRRAVHNRDSDSSGDEFWTGSSSSVIESSKSANASSKRCKQHLQLQHGLTERYDSEQRRIGATAAVATAATAAAATAAAAAVDAASKTRRATGVPVAV